MKASTENNKTAQGMIKQLDEADELFHTAFEVKDLKQADVGDFIVLRKDQEVKLVARVHQQGLSLYYKTDELFQEFLRVAAVRIETIIHTIGPEPVRKDEYTGRLYNPSNTDAYEMSRVVRDVTGLSF